MQQTIRTKEKGYINKDNSKDNLLEKKKLLQEQFIKNITKSSLNKPKANKEDNLENLQIEECHKELDNIKKENSRLKKQNKLKNEKIDDKNKELYKYKIKILDLNERTKNLEDENKSIMELNSELLVKIENLKNQQSYYNDKILELNNIIETLSESHLLEENNNLKTLVEELKLKNDKNIRQIENFKLGLVRKSNRIEHLENVDNNATIETLRRHIRNQKQQLSMLNSRLQAFQKQTKRDSFKKRFLILSDKLKEIFKKQNNNKNKINIKVHDEINITNKEPIIKEYQYGILEKYANRYIFKNVNGVEYLVLKNNDNKFNSMKKNLGNPCMASITTKNDAIIETIYNKQNKYIDEKINNRIIKGKSVMNKIKDSEENENHIILSKNSYKILIIGSLYKNKYVKALTNVGIENIIWFDSYENEIPRLKELLKSSDIVLCCTSHSKHSTSELLKNLKLEDKNNPFKYNIIKKDNINNIISRVRFVINSLESN